MSDQTAPQASQEPQSTEAPIVETTTEAPITSEAPSTEAPVETTEAPGLLERALDAVEGVAEAAGEAIAGAVGDAVDAVEAVADRFEAAVKTDLEKLHDRIDALDTRGQHLIAAFVRFLTPEGDL